MTETAPQNRIIGYARVSTYGQTLNAQLEQLKAARCAKVYREKATGARIERRELQRLLKAIVPGDVVTVTRIDRLARSTFDLFSIVKAIADAGGQFRSLAEPWADSSTSVALPQGGRYRAEFVASPEVLPVKAHAAMMVSSLGGHHEHEDDARHAHGICQCGPGALRGRGK